MMQNKKKTLTAHCEWYFIFAFLNFFPKTLPISNQFRSGLVYPCKWGWPDLPHFNSISPTPTLHLARFKASSFSKPTLLLSLSTCVFHVFLGRPRLLLPFTSNSNTFLKTCPSHSIPFSFHSPFPSEPPSPSIPTSPLGPLFSVLFFSITFHHTLLSPWLSQSFSKFPFPCCPGNSNKGLFSNNS